MLDVISAKAGRLRSVTETGIEQRKAIAGLGDDDIPRITSLKSMIEQRADHGAEVFFNQLVKIAAPKLFARRGVLDQARQRKRDRSRRRTRRQRGRGAGSAAMSGALTWPAPILFERTALLSRSAVFTSPSTMSVEKTVLAA